MTLLLLLACEPEPETETEPVAPLPEVWGLPAAPDMHTGPHTVGIELRASESQVQWIDGEEPTEIWAYNDQTPGPLIQARVGDRVIVRFENDLDDETTIHWHGLRIDDAMDGVPHIQEPVQPGGSFTYDFVVPDPGSYWYHPHVRSNEQIERGLQGALVVHEEVDPDVDLDRYFVLDDVLLDSDGEITSLNMSHMDEMHGRHGNTLLVNGSTEPLTDTARAGSLERWRIVNTANARTMWVAVTGASSWRIVGTDGGLLAEPYTQDRVELPVGQRWDLEVIPDPSADAVGLQVELPSSATSWAEYPVFEAEITGDDQGREPMDWPAAPLFETAGADQEIALEFQGAAVAAGIDWMINGETFDDHEPIVVAGHTLSTIAIHNVDTQEHPFHLHGQFFQILERNGRDAEEPGLKDTVLVGGEDDVLLATEFDNPGEWMAHCHILEHAELGMMTTMIVEE